MYLPKNLYLSHVSVIAKTLVNEGAKAALDKIDFYCEFTAESKRHCSNADFFEYLDQREAMLRGMLAMMDACGKEIKA